MTRALEDIGEVHRKIGGAWEECGEILRKVGGAWVPVWRKATTLTASVVFPEVYGARTSSGSIVVTTETAFLNISGGRAPYTISWARVGSGSPAWTINNGTTENPSFSVNVGPGNIEQATFEATITDSLGASPGAAPSILATAENYGGFA